MEYLQYSTRSYKHFISFWSFKPYYNWNAFNTYVVNRELYCGLKCFKPYYNWNTFNTAEEMKKTVDQRKEVLNLIITGIPSILSPEHEDRHPSMSLF